MKCKGIIVIMGAAMLLSGCGKTLYAGSAVKDTTEYKDAVFNEKTEALWYDGDSTIEAELTVNLTEGDAAKEKEAAIMDIVPKEEMNTSHFDLVTVNSDKVHVPVRVINYQSNPSENELTCNGISYSGYAYQVSDTEYLLPIPNGMTKYTIVCGNLCFSVEDSQETGTVAEGTNG